MSLILDGTNGLSDVDGSAATPAIRGSDENTGIFFDADIIGFSEGGTECARFNADAQFVAAAGTASLPVITTTGDVNTGIFFPAADTIAFTEGGAEAMRIDSSGNLLLGTTSASGEGLTAFPSGGLGLTPQLLFNRPSSSTSGAALVFRNGGSNVGTIAYTNTATSYNTSSDYRLKHDIQPMTGALEKVAALKPVTYKWKVDGSDGQGFIAHELQEVCPNAVSGEKDGEQMQGVDYGKITPLLTAALQEQQAIITALTARVEALEGAQA